MVLLARRESTRTGGARTPERDAEFYAHIGKAGGQRLLAERGYLWFAEIGRKGGIALRERNGPDYFRFLGRRGGVAGRKRLRVETCSLVEL
jgi:general stress protein YciG